MPVRKAPAVKTAPPKTVWVNFDDGVAFSTLAAARAYALEDEDVLESAEHDGYAYINGIEFTRMEVRS